MYLEAKTQKEPYQMPVFTALDFLSAFFSILKKENVNIISATEMFKAIGKYRNEFLPLFIDIDIINNEETVCSQDLEEGISMLQILGVVGKANPKYERIILKMNKNTADDVISKCDDYYLNKIKEFATKFLNETKGDK